MKKAQLKASRRALGRVQREVLRCLQERGGYWHPHCGWSWNGARTVQIMESLYRIGLVRLGTFEFCQNRVAGFRLTKAGKAARIL